MRAFRTILPESNMLAYLAMMAPRLVELRRVLKSTGSLYLHCDPTASHYLKLLLDAVLSPKSFRNEIIWQRTLSKGLMKTRLPNNHDVILGYQAGKGAVWNLDAAFQPYDPENLDEKTAKSTATTILTGGGTTSTTFSIRIMTGRIWNTSSLA
jgi:adenine specific DNA methylase Mod